MPDRPVTRRTTVALAVGAIGTPLALAACDVAPQRSSAAPTATPDPDPDSAAEPDADARLVSDVIGALVASRATLEAATASVPGLTPRLQALAEAHGQHLDLLLGSTAGSAETSPEVADPPALKAGRRAALRAVHDSEQVLLAQTRRACLAAASGDLARVLASIAASTAQHSAALTGEPGDETAGETAGDAESTDGEGQG